ncbi:hypothetical protein SAMN05444358_11337 [Ruegeria halocynthiae]|uniref:Uncharacterized protein n=1 Tax=Ruegeria halocynthiae TaxID=985054 RepID=A0A1H3F423_9RHOB|nr:hypothetical protein SAMN05444358_11337 [Ruegeria halocynthiae]
MLLPSGQIRVTRIDTESLLSPYLLELDVTLREQRPL